MARIFYWAADSSGCRYYRCDLPAQALRARGHEVWVSQNLTQAPLDIEVVIGQRVCLPGPTQGWQALAATGRYRMVYELDDDLLDIDPSNVRAWEFYNRPEVRENVIHNIAVSDLVTVSTEPLAELVAKLNPRVVVLPNCVPEALLTVPRPRTEGVTLGWSGGASHRLDLAELGSNLPRFVRRHPEVSLHVMGDAQAHVQLSKGVKQARFTPWVESVPEFHAAIDFDITLAPLRPSPFNRSKSAIRCLEAAALGIPVVASDFGPYAEFVVDGQTGRLARWPHQWMSHLRDLLDPEVRDAMGMQARELAAQHTIENNIELWEQGLGL